VAVVLQPAADHVRVLHVGADFVELADRQIVAKEPGLPAIPGDRHAAVAADDQVIGIVGIDPQRVIFGMDGAEHVAKRPAAVVGDVEAAVRTEQVDAVAVARIGANLAVVHRPRIERRPRLPGVAAVGAAVDAGVAAGCFHDREDEPRIAAEDVQADAALVT
jgi:hypothetical protein